MFKAMVVVVTGLALLGTASADKISKATAAAIAGTKGISRSQVTKAQAKMLAATRALRDTKRNGEVDAFELSQAAKQARLTKAERSAIWSVSAAARLQSDPDGRNNRVLKNDMIDIIKGNGAEARRVLGRSTKITGERLYARYGNSKQSKGLGLASSTWRFLLAAKAARH